MKKTFSLIAILLVTSVSGHCTMSAADIAEDEMIQRESDRRMEEAERQAAKQEEEARQSQYSDREESYDEDSNCHTTTVSPRMLSASPRMTGSQRENIFHKIEDLTRDAMREVSKANEICSHIIDPDARFALSSILADCTASFYGGVATCYAACCYAVIEIGYHLYYKLPEYKEAKVFMKNAEKKFHEAALLEEMLWYDNDAEDWM